VADLPPGLLNLTPEVQVPSAPRSTTIADTCPARVLNPPAGQVLGLSVGAEDIGSAESRPGLETKIVREHSDSQTDFIRM
jgi:hypothetical protein